MLSAPQLLVAPCFLKVLSKLVGQCFYDQISKWVLNQVCFGLVFLASRKSANLQFDGLSNLSFCRFFANDNFVVFELTNQHCSHHLCNVFVLMTFFCSTVSFNWMIWSWFVLTICAPNIAFPTTNQLCGPNSKIEIMWHFQQNPFRFEKTTTPNLLTGGTNHRKMNVLSFNNAMMTAL